MKIINYISYPMNVYPIGDRVLILPSQAEEVSRSGIVIPETVDKEKKAEGKIIALGRGENLAKLELEKDDIVLFEKWGGDDVKIDGVEYKIINYDKLLAVIE